MVCAGLLQRGGISEITAETEADNAASQRVLEKNGFELVEKNPELIRYRKLLK